MVILVHGMAAISRGLPARRVVSLKIQIPLGTRRRGEVGQVGHQVVLIVRPGGKLVLEMMDAGARSDLTVPLNSPVSGSTTEYILELLAASTASLQRVASRSCRARSATCHSLLTYHSPLQLDHLAPEVVSGEERAQDTLRRVDGGELALGVQVSAEDLMSVSVRS